MFVKFTSVKLQMIDHTADYDTGYILWIHFDRKHLIYIDDQNSPTRTAVPPHSTLGLHSWKSQRGAKPAQNGIAAKKWPQHLSAEDIVSVIGHPRNVHRNSGH